MIRHIHWSLICMAPQGRQSNTATLKIFRKLWVWGNLTLLLAGLIALLPFKTALAQTENQWLQAGNPVYLTESQIAEQVAGTVQNTSGYSRATISARELIVNGGFDQGLRAWHLIGVGSGVRDNAAQNGGPALAMENITDNTDPRAIALQTLHLPTQLTRASFSFNYQLIQEQGGYGGNLTLFLMKGANLDQAESIGGIFESGWATQTTQWQVASGTLTAQQVQAAQAARDAGDGVWLVFILYQAGSPSHFAPNQFKALLDNVSFKADGSMNYPKELGSIAFIGAHDDGFPKTVNRIEPDGSGQQTIWSHPETSTPRYMFDVAWKPDGSEIAFSSNHEGSYSAFNSDVYGIKPDGSDLRRITNPPSKAEIEAGTYPVGTVTGRISNNYGNVISFLVYVQGARQPVSLNIGGWQQVTSFNVPNVAYTGNNPHYIVLMWSGTQCANGREYAAAAVRVTPGQVTDAGTIIFSGTCGAYNSNHITWKRDGQEIGVDVIAPRRFAAAGETIGRDLFSASLTADKPAWSPIDDSVLYYDAISSARGIYRTTAGGGAGTRIISMGGAFSVDMSWLPDGSGFVYTWDNELRQFLFAGNQDRLLVQLFHEYADSPSVSGDGAYVVFERRSLGAHSDLWVVQRARPNQLWALTSNGKSSRPDWSRTVVPAPLSDQQKAEIIFNAAEHRYPEWFYPTGLAVERSDEYPYVMYYRYYSAQKIFLLTYNGAVYYHYNRQYKPWFTVDQWLQYLGYR